MGISWVSGLITAGLAGQAASAHLPQNWVGTAVSSSVDNVAQTTSNLEFDMSRKTGAILYPFKNFTSHRVVEHHASNELEPTVTISSSTQIRTSNPVPSTETSYVTYTKTIELIKSPKLVPSENAINGERETVTEYVCSTPTDSAPIATTLITKHVYPEKLQPTTDIITSTVTVGATLTLEEVDSTVLSIPVIGGPQRSTTQPSTRLATSLFKGPGVSGWNSSASRTTSEGDDNMGNIKVISKTARQPYGNQNRPANHVASLVPFEHARINERQVGDIVVATMNGQVVSWTNEWNGRPTSTAITLATSFETSEITETLPSATSTQSPSPTSCGGMINIDFDDLPRYSPSKNVTSSFPPIFSPYHQLFFSAGWKYGPPPAIPFSPLSNPHVGVFSPMQLGNGNNLATRSSGGFGAGPRAHMKLYWFDVLSAYFGCSNGNDNMPCTVNVAATRYSSESKSEVPAGNAMFTIPPCPGYENCELTSITLGKEFRGITGIKFEASVMDKAVMWFIDDIKIKFHGDGCQSERLREQSGW